MSYPQTSEFEQAIDELSSAIVLLDHAQKEAEGRQEKWNILRIACMLKVVQTEMEMHLETAWQNYPEISAKKP